MNRTPNKTMAARLAWSVVAAMIAAAALPVAFVPKQDSIGEAILAQLSKNKSKASQATVTPALLDSQETVPTSESELLRATLSQALVASPSRIRAMDVALTRAVAVQSSQILATDVALARGILVRSLRDPLPSARLIHSRGLLRLADPELTVQEAGVLKVTADAALLNLKQNPLGRVSFSTQKADQNEKYIALLEKYIALLEKHLKSLGAAPDAKVGFTITSGGTRLPGFVTSTAPSASSAVKAVTAAYARGIVLGRTVDVTKFQVRPTNVNVKFDKAVANLVGNFVVVDQSKASGGKTKVMVVEVGERTFWIAAGPNATVNVSTEEGRIQIVEADGKKFWVALKPGTVKAEGKKLEVKVVEIDGKKVWIVTTPRKKEKADKIGG